MTDGLEPPGTRDIPVVGAVASLEEAEEMTRMRFVLVWAVHLGRIARPVQARAARRSAPPM